MTSKMKRYISQHLINLPGWKTDRKIVVLESDDWGSIRMPSKKVYKQCLQAGYRVDRIAYERFDSLASEDDLELLFELLSSFKDQQGNPAVITSNILAANPDFEKIKSTDFQEYAYELVPETFKRYPKHSKCFDLWKKGKEAGVFYPQSHGREHLNVSKFMQALRRGDKDARFGFEHNMPGCISKEDSKGGNKFVESLWYANQKDKEEKLAIAVEGLELFETLMGYRSETFIPPNYLWSPNFDAVLSAAGVRFYQGLRIMKEPGLDGKGTVSLHPHKLGEENAYGQRYLIRNAFFEPSLVHSGENSVDQCLKDISVAFRMSKPAVICSHRLNYVGFIDEENRDRNLKLLNSLLHKIIKQWPDVEFFNSLQLGNLITNKNG